VQAGVPAERTSVIYDGVDTELFSPRDRTGARAQLNLPQEGRIILFVGSLRPVKGPEHLVQAFAKLADSGTKDLRLVMVGTGPLEQALRARVRDLGLTDRVTFAGACLHREVSTWMAAADLLCLPSIDEGLPNVVLEALACARPVVASSVGGLAEVIDDDCLGTLVPPGDPDSLASALGEALDRKWDTDVLLGKARQFSWPEHGARIADVLKSVITNRGG
jgi:glycosyltransferase involved in cell wall biosynthesis